MESAKILIIEDDRDVLLGLSIRLKANGYSVVGATDGATGMMAYRREMPDLIILDLGLPAGDGFKVMEWMSRMHPVLTPIIVLTARDPVSNRQKAMSAGAMAFLQKPVDNDELLAAIRAGVKEASCPMAMAVS